MRILISGASRGIGRALAKTLALDGHQVLGLARNEEGLQTLQNEIINLFPKARFSYLKIDLEAIDQKVIGKALQELGGLDILVNNAGLLIKKPFAQLKADDWQRSFAVNVWSVVELIQIAFPFLEASSSAHIVNIGSMGGYPGTQKYPDLITYAASKAALANLSETLSQTFLPNQIAVNCLALGAVQTEMLAEAFPDYQAEVSPEGIADYIAHFCVHGQKVYNGKVLPVSRSNP